MIICESYFYFVHIRSQENALINHYMILRVSDVFFMFLILLYTAIVTPTRQVLANVSIQKELTLYH